VAPPDRGGVSSSYATPCPDCKQPILWPWTRASDCTIQMPVDAGPTDRGNVKITVEGRRLVADVIGKSDDRRKMILGGWPLYLHHSQSCTKSNSWSRNAPKRRPEPLRTTEAPDGLW
jgi:hypothetical protein